MPHKDPVARKAYRKQYDAGRPPRRDPAYLASVARGRRRAAGKHREWLWSYKAKCGCKDCGLKDHRVLDFDHRDRRKKSFTISSIVGRVSMARLMAEVAKCDVRCANCHRIKTWEENKRGRGS